MYKVYLFTDKINIKLDLKKHLDRTLEQWNQKCKILYGMPLDYRVRRVSPVQTQEQNVDK
jgi:hypothetical protein